jgi:hypothetical protein
MKPAQRRAVKTAVNKAKTEIARLERAIQRFTPGTLPHDKLTRELADLRQRGG